ncbi:hypothetical protein [Pseudalkalibacillus decolorationis]|uniref:hypothetical protein n=1 Tax=Pseudalkalibacillus decolorationis TaxID=163879 RepID=UPI0021485AB1|nr:hypothetical protein [Pseudalkalibacillus decolorationis]
MLNRYKAKRKAKEAGNDVKPWIRGFARFGHLAKGMVFILVGTLSGMAAFGVGGKTTGANGGLGFRCKPTL